MKQVDAAKTFGLSLTAFKSACRRVGIHRWPYLRKQGASTERQASLAQGRRAGSEGDSTSEEPEEVSGQEEGETEGVARRKPVCLLPIESLVNTSEARPYSPSKESSGYWSPTHSREQHDLFDEALDHVLSRYWSIRFVYIL
ncbi:hypothetical protein GUITHDRAFT_106150 [Guillardia theta CCMP2712]|uniref:RWP-RK domain-containing protein n=1 Tax=Guillardia theta (strain CCMP2712) TaxID=905079 RepID=L1JIZ8_GUITC|nr:hypothetical protein GUITHDRAFT_106150 [Guillardia theta CCMP2712]EKX48070.1 hypothetical protein GUITHDRAFT_106150 [Guillardia theta CCMP2712]|eukprot:XP_005835050.1 hypothetical protein GUITHDRAFT_106150 [Guillardia theta CCMP2712]